MSNYIVTGASRGIGFELVRQIAALSLEQVRSVVAVTRVAPNEPLRQLIAQSQGRVTNVVIEDITNEESVQTALPLIRDALPGEVVDVLVNNAGIMGPSVVTANLVSTQQLQEVFRVNVSSVQAMTSALLPLMKSSKTRKVINISAALGSISYVKQTSSYQVHAYKIAKAALNMLTAQYAVDFEKDGFTFLAISPGWLKTDMGSEGADLDVSVGVESVKQWILQANKSHNGKFVNISVPGWGDLSGFHKYNGDEIPW